MSKKTAPKKLKTLPNEQLSIMQVAIKIGRGYQTTRNMMLHKTFGATQYDEKTRRLTVSASGVVAYLAHLKTQAKTTAKTPVEVPA